jgi:hypothetical protein
MPRQNAYHQWLKKDLGTLIDALELSDLQKHFLRSRWLDQVIWMEGRADNARNWHYRLRLTVIIGGVIIPALVSLNTPALMELNLGGGIAQLVGCITFGLSLMVALSAAVEQFFNYGERWRHYRRMVETLKIEGWQFFQLSGPYHRYKSHREAYPVFAARTEETNQHDVESYITNIVREKEEDKEEKPKEVVRGLGR